MNVFEDSADSSVLNPLKTHPRKIILSGVDLFLNALSVSMYRRF